LAKHTRFAVHLTPDSIAAGSPPRKSVPVFAHDEAPRVRKVHEGIANHEALTSTFGKWPSFHDAEILRMRLDRGLEEPPSVEADIHLWEMTSDVDERGFYVLTNHTLVTLRFDGIRELELNGFNHQNVLSNLELEDLSELATPGVHWGVSLPSSFGVGGRFVCASISVARAEPYAAK
jgi:hypothetical protein